MLFTLNWINQYVDLKDKTPEEINVALNNLGLETEGYKPLCYAQGLVSGKVVKKEKHPDADKLSVCQVDIGKEVTQIVCGAKNFKEEEYVIVSLPGAVLPGNFKIKASEIRGQKSNGMMCSLKEIGYPKDLLTKEEATGIFRQEKEIELGREDVLSILGLDDVIFEINVTPNRGDWLSVYEIAKELAVYFEKNLKELETSKIEYKQVDNSIENNAALGFSLTKISNIKNSESNSKFGQLLSTSGVSLVSTVVDIYNYVAKEIGQPIHLYDYSKIKGQIKVRKGLEGSFVAIGGQELKVTKDDLVIVDDNGIIGLAGVIGSESTKIDLNTTEAIMEVACFDGPTVRRTSQRTLMHTDASNRYTKQTSPDNIKKTIERIKFVFEKELNAKFDITELSGQSDIAKTKINFSYDSIMKYLGFEISKEKVLKIFNKLGFDYKGNIVEVPAYRIDITIEADLIEELARINGYDNIIEKFGEFKPTIISNDSSYDFVANVKKLLAAKNNHEVITYSLTSKDQAQDFKISKSTKYATLSQPLSEERSTMRRSLIPSMLEVIKWNSDRGVKDINIFEVSKIYDLEKSFTELGIMQSGNVINDPLYDIVVPASFITIKKQFESLMSDLGIFNRRYQIKPMKENKFFNHFNACEIYMGKDLIARIGQIHPMIIKKQKIADVYLAQIKLDVIMSQIVSDVKVKEVSIYPNVSQDYTIDVARDLEVEKLLMIARKSSKLISDIAVTSIYNGDKIDESKKAVTLKINYNNPKDTIKDSEIKEFRKSFIDLCIKEGFKFRG